MATYNKKDRQRVRDFVDSLKSGPCSDCGIKFHPCVMDFDHRRGNKIAAIAAMVRNKSGKEQILKEVAKCDLVCANCHRIRTHITFARSTTR